MLAAAGALRPAYRRNPARVRAALDAALRERRRAQNPAESREDAGTGDGLDETQIHQEELELPDGGQLVLTDIEEITPERAEATAARIARLLKSRERDRLS